MSQARVLANYVSSGVTAAEFDFLDITTVGTSQASKAVTADASGDVDIASHDGTNGLKLGGTLVTTTAADLNNSATTGKSIAMAIVFGGG